MRKNKPTLLIFVTLLLCQNCSSSHDIVDHFFPSYYSNEQCDVIDTITAPIDSVYLIEVAFGRLYQDFTPMNPDSCYRKLYYYACGHSLFEAMENRADSSYVLKGTSIVDVFGHFAIKNVNTNRYVDLLAIKVGDTISNEDQTELQELLYPLLLDYSYNYKKQAESFTTVVSSKYYHEDYIISPKRTIIVLPDTLR